MQVQRDKDIQQDQQQSPRAQTQKALEQAEKDIEKDPELSAHSPNDDLDEGQTARLGEGKNDLI